MHHTTRARGRESTLEWIDRFRAKPVYAGDNKRIDLASMRALVVCRTLRRVGNHMEVLQHQRLYGTVPGGNPFASARKTGRKLGAECDWPYIR